MAKARIKENAWGNWYGYIGNRRVAEFGTSERKANHWLRQQQGEDLIDRVFEYLGHQLQYASRASNRKAYDNYDDAMNLVLRLM